MSCERTARGGGPGPRNALPRMLTDESFAAAAGRMRLKYADHDAERALARAVEMVLG
jgi:hypothetical protein